MESDTSNRDWGFGAWSVRFHRVTKNVLVFYKQFRDFLLEKFMSESKRLLVFATILLSMSVTSAAREISREEAIELMKDCQEQREKKIAPLREEAIQDCVADDRGNREYCERYNSTFGNAVALPGGGMYPGLFWDLPDCVQAVQVEKYFKLNPGKHTYNLE